MNIRDHIVLRTFNILKPDYLAEMPLLFITW